MAVNHVPNGYQTINAGVNIKEAAKAIEWYKKVLGAEERMRMPGPNGAIMHCELQIGNSVLMLSEAVNDPVQTVSAMVYVKDCDAVFNKAVQEGATVRMPLTDHFWGDRAGRVSDPFGNSWFIATHKEDLTPAQIQERLAKMSK